MAKWVRALIRPAGASTKWHVLASEKEFASANSVCGERFPYAVESASSEERVERDGRCEACDAALSAKHREDVAVAQR